MHPPVGWLGGALQSGIRGAGFAAFKEKTDVWDRVKYEQDKATRHGQGVRAELG